MRGRNSGMVAVLCDLVPVCAVVSARTIFACFGFKPDLDGKRRAAGNRRVVLMQALAMAAWVQPNFLCAANRFRRGLWNGLDGVALWTRIVARTPTADDGLVACRLSAAS